ncbi:reverse transcriptase domain-containing protein, partial [Tanacetum coccineum]
PPVIKQYLEKTKKVLRSFDSYTMEHVLRDQNKKADALSKLVSMTISHLANEVLVEVLDERSIARREVTNIIKEEGVNWMLSIWEYLLFGLLPKDPQRTRKLRIKAPQYRVIDGNLYRKSYLSPWLRCVGPIQAKSIIQEVHQGSCGMHVGSRSVVSKIMKLGYYWPSMHIDAKAKIQKCEACQIHSSVPRMPKQDMTSITSTWTFSQWGTDIVGPLPMAPRGARFRVPQIIIFDNGKQFAEGIFSRHRQGNETKVEKNHQGWIDELPQVLWAHKTSPKSSNGETLFSLTYGSKAVVPIEISVETERVKEFKARKNDKRCRENLDILEE